ncbi:MAG: hypothetical protein M1347_01500 [Chloroflexi bacterium]|nr:hypothetical protein [Chloroflexota bacterium]
MSNDDRIERAARAEGFEPPKQGSTRRFGIFIGILAILLLAGAVAAIIWLMQPGAPTETLRDVFIILVAFEFMIIGIALVILIIQLARLVNLLNNEVRPILDSASEAANTMRGTARFLSDKLVSPIVKVNAGAAAARRALELLRFWKR